LGTFKDGCGKFNLYYYRALFLASVGIAEFENCRSADSIVELLFYHAFNNEWELFFNPIAESARAIVLETVREQAINYLNYYRNNSQDEYICREAIYLLKKFGIHHEKSHNDSDLPPLSDEEETLVNYLFNQAKNNFKESSMSIETLVKYVDDNPKGMINYLIKNMEQNENNETWARVIKSLRQPNHLHFFVKKIKRYVDSNSKDEEYFDSFYDVIWHCAQNMNYQEFYDAWHF
jgi:hypothetical protein